MIINFKNKLKVSILHKKKHIKLKAKENLILLQTQSFFWIKKTKARLNSNQLNTKLLYNKLYAKKKNKYINTHVGGLASYTIKKKNLITTTFFTNFFSGNSANSKKIQLDLYNGLTSKHFLILNTHTNKFYNLSSQFFIATFFFFFKKITFKGKGFKLKKTKKKTFKFFFGSSHFICFYNNIFISKKFGKQKHLFFSTKLKKLKKGLLVFLAIKPVSWYTKRGLRFTKQIIQRRAGKKSTH